MRPTKSQPIKNDKATAGCTCVSCFSLSVLFVIFVINSLSNLPTPAPQSSPTPTKTETAKKAKQEKQQDERYKADMKTFVHKVSEIEGSSGVIKSAERDQFGDLRITVSNAWHYKPFQTRLQLAQNLWKLWARIHSRQEPDKAKITLVDENGNHIGGSSSFAGSIVSVDKD